MPQAAEGNTTNRPFRINVPEAELVDLRRRINATKWPERETVTDASQGVQLATTQKLARYWGTEYDWRTCEAKLNALPQFITEIDGLDMHCMHVRSQHAHALVLTELSESCLLVGRVDEASTLAARLLELSHTHTGPGYQAHACRLLGKVARRRKPLEIDQATAHYHHALVLAEEVGMRPLQAHCHRGLGTLYTQTGQRQKARAELSAAMGLYCAMNMTFWLPQTEAVLAQMDTQ
jgi:hypothetical protein